MSPLKVLFGGNSSHPLWKDNVFRAKFALRSLFYPVSTFRYIKKITSLDIYPQVISIQGIILAKHHRVYLKKGSSVAERVKYITDHYSLINSMSNISLKNILISQSVVSIAQFSGKQGEEFTLYCKPGNFDREGEITIIMDYQGHTVSLITFSIVNINNKRTLLIGGLQGPNNEGASDLIREATKSASGLFPKRIMMEVISVFSGLLSAESVCAVSDDMHVFKSSRYHRKKGKLLSSYNDFWLSLGGTLKDDNTFELPVIIERKKIEDIASKKRSEYKRRYQLLDDMKDSILTTASGEAVTVSHQAVTV